MTEDRRPHRPAGIIGLIGGIGSGKTTVAGMLEGLGACVIHADAVGHDVYLPATPGWAAVVEAFGDDVVAGDGSIDRKRLGAIVFADSAALRRLNAIVHPLIGDAIRARIAATRAAGFTAPIVVEAAILIEAGWRSLVDQVWLVAAPRAAAAERLQAQRGLSPEEVRRRVDVQLTDDERRVYADVVIENEGSLASLQGQVTTAWQRLMDVSR